jgi:hypothetical protein
MTRESVTVEAMIALYCHGQHRDRLSQDELCPECTQLLEYARERLDNCPFQEGKTTCAKCPVHCYRPDMRAKIHAAMRYAGPHMIWRHPILALYHLIDGLRKEPLRRDR